MNRNIPKLNLILALMGVGILFLFFLANYLTFGLLDTEYNGIRRTMSYVYAFGSIPMMFLILGLSILSIIISVTCIFKRTHNSKSIIALLVSLITLIICTINTYLQFAYEQSLVDMIF